MHEQVLTLIEALHSGDDDTHKEAYEALVRIGREAVPVLIEQFAGIRGRARLSVILTRPCSSGSSAASRWTRSSCASSSFFSVTSVQMTSTDFGLPPASRMRVHRLMSDRDRPALSVARSSPDHCPVSRDVRSASSRCN